jgi:hypothetical protein
MITLGYILVAVTINAEGIVMGEALDYYREEYGCWKNSIFHKEEALPGTSFVCIEDVVEE